MNLTSIITWIIVGGVAGGLAEMLIGGIHTGCIGTILVGIVGAFVGGWLLGSVLHVSLGLTGIVNDIVVAFIGAAVLVLVLKILRRA